MRRRIDKIPAGRTPCRHGTHPRRHVRRSRQQCRRPPAQAAGARRRRRLHEELDQRGQPGGRLPLACSDIEDARAVCGQARHRVSRREPHARTTGERVVDVSIGWIRPRGLTPKSRHHVQPGDQVRRVSRSGRKPSTASERSRRGTMRGGRRWSCADPSALARSNALGSTRSTYGLFEGAGQEQGPVVLPRARLSQAQLARRAVSHRGSRKSPSSGQLARRGGTPLLRRRRTARASASSAR